MFEFRQAAAFAPRCTSPERLCLLAVWMCARVTLRPLIDCACAQLKNPEIGLPPQNLNSLPFSNSPKTLKSSPV